MQTFWLSRSRRAPVRIGSVGLWKSPSILWTTQQEPIKQRGAPASPAAMIHRNPFRGAALVALAVLAVSALMIVSNTIRLALYSREDELDILSLVGASRTFIRVPFLLEGTIQGLAGGLLAVTLLYVAFQAFSSEIQFGLSFFLGSAKPRFFGWGEIIALVSGGAALGMLGSVAALFGWRGTTGS